MNVTYRGRTWWIDPASTLDEVVELLAFITAQWRDGLEQR